MKHVFYSIFCFLFSIVSPLRAQIYNFQNYSVENGLPSNLVYSICQQKNGYMWFATFGNGVCRFDGKSYVFYNTDLGLNNDNVRCLMVDNKDNVWIGTSRGINIYDGNKLIDFFKDWEVDTLGEIISIYQARNNDIWIGSLMGIMRFDGKSITRYSYKHGLPDRRIACIYEDTQGNMLFGGFTGGVYIFNPKKNNFKIISKKNGLPSDIVLSIMQNTDGTYWFGTSEGIGLYKNGRFIDTLSTNDGLCDNRIRTLLKEKSGAIWIGTTNGISLYNNGMVTNFNTHNGLSNSFVRKIYQDAENNIWIATEGGAFRFNYNFIHYNTNNGLIDNSTKCAVTDKYNNAWIATTKGISYIQKNGTIKNYNTDNGLPSNNTLSVCVDKKNHLWITTQDKGVIWFDGNSFKTIDTSQGLPNNWVLSSMVDSKGNIWIGTRNGLCIFNDERTLLKKYQIAPNELTSAFSVSINEDKKGNIWLCHGKGVSKFKDNRFQHFEGGFELRLGAMGTSVDDDYLGNTWIGTSDGLGFYNGDTIKILTRKDGLPTNNITGIRYYNNHLYIGSNIGLIKINLPFFYKYNKLNFKIINKNEGFIGVECKEQIIHLDAKGKLWICHNKGVSVYDPKADENDNLEPKLHLTGLKLFYENTNWGSFSDSVLANNIPHYPVLAHNENHLTFEFIGILLQNPGKVQYSYKLEGVDKDWSPPKYTNQITYSNIPPGKHRFLLRASVGNDVWSKDPLIFEFEILKPYWKQWWFYLLCLLFAGLILYLYIKTREKNLKARQKELEIKVDERTEQLKEEKLKVLQKNDELFKTNLLINESIEYAQKIQESILPSASAIEKFLDKDARLFIFYRPKDVVSGDFYWVSKHENELIFAAIDCTGHGVPGAFMSIIANNLLTKIIAEKKITTPSLILDEMDKLLLLFFAQNNENEETLKNGMDIALCKYNPQTRELQYAGAYNPLYLIRNKELTEFKANRKTIGHEVKNKQINYTNNSILTHPGDLFYLFSDGYTDQKGGPENKRFLAQNFKQLLLSISDLAIPDQEKSIESEFLSWKGTTEQIDDVLVMGIKIV